MAAGRRSIPPIEDGARLVVPCVIGRDHPAPQHCLKLRDRNLFPDEGEVSTVRLIGPHRKF